MAASVKLYGDTYNYTISNITNSITVTPSNRNSRYGAVYTTKPTVTINSKHACTRYIFISTYNIPSGKYLAVYKAVFTSSSTTATVTEVSTNLVAPLGNFVNGLSQTITSFLDVSISTSSSINDEFDTRTLYNSLTFIMSGWNPSAPTINYATSQSATGDPDPSIFGLIAGYAKASWSASGNTTWSYSLNGFSGTIAPQQTLTLSANGASQSTLYSTGTQSASLAAKVLSATSVTGTAKLTNKLGGSTTSTNTVTVQPYSMPIAKSLAVGRVTVNNKKHASMSIGWSVNELNKQSTASQSSIKSGAITCTWECEDLSNTGVLFSSGEFDIVSDGDAMTVLTDTATETLVDTSGKGHDEYDSDKSFRFTAYITDRIGQSSLTISAILASDFYLICAREGGRGIGFGMVPPDDGMHVKMPATFYENFAVVGMAGTIQMFAGSTAPTGWLMCDGSAVSRATYATLFAVIGTTYGVGDGSTTFNLPDMRGRVAVGVGNGTATEHTNHTLGEQGGRENAITPYHAHTVTATQSGVSITGGSHSHALSGNNKTVQSGSNYMRPKTYSTSESTVSGYTTSSTTHTHTLPAHTHTISYAGTNGEATGANMQPYLAINYIIATGNTA